MKHRLYLLMVCACLLSFGSTFRPAQAQASAGLLVVGCRNFLVTGVSYIVTPYSQFAVSVTDAASNVVYSRNSGVTPSRYGGYGAPFSVQPTYGPVHVTLTLDGHTIYDVTGNYLGNALCATFNWRNDASFLDARINLADPWENVAVYCYGDGTVSVLKPRYPGDLNSVEAIRVTQRQLARLQKPGQMTLIQSHYGVSLYQLQSGALEIISPTSETGKNYTFTWGGC